MTKKRQRCQIEHKDKNRSRLNGIHRERTSEYKVRWTTGLGGQCTREILTMGAVRQSLPCRRTKQLLRGLRTPRGRCQLGSQKRQRKLQEKARSPRLSQMKDPNLTPSREDEAGSSRELTSALQKRCKMTEQLYRRTQFATALKYNALFALHRT